MRRYEAVVFSFMLTWLASLPAAAQGLVGAWSQQTGAVEGAHVVGFLGNGYHVQIQNATAAEAPHGVVRLVRLS